MNDDLLHIWINCADKYLFNLVINNTPYEYYWMNKNHPECVLYDMSDYEIAYKYPLSGERLVLDCWSLAKEHADIKEEEWEQFILFVHDYIINCLLSIKEVSNERRTN